MGIEPYLDSTLSTPEKEGSRLSLTNTDIKLVENIGLEPISDSLQRTRACPEHSPLIMVDPIGIEPMNLLNANQALSQLSYGTIKLFNFCNYIR